MSYSGKVIYTLLLEVHNTRISSDIPRITSAQRKKMALYSYSWIYLGLAENVLKLGSEICDVQDFNIFRQMMKVNEMMHLELNHCHIRYISYDI